MTTSPIVTAPGSLWTALLWFFAVIALIPLVLWLLKRSPLTGLGGQPAAGLPRTVAVMPLSAQQQLVTVEVGQGEDRVWLVLGVTPHSVRTVHTMAPLTPATAASGKNATTANSSVGPTTGPTTGSTAGTTFAQLLGRIRKGPAAK